MNKSALDGKSHRSWSKFLWAYIALTSVPFFFATTHLFLPWLATLGLNVNSPLLPYTTTGVFALAGFIILREVLDSQSRYNAKNDRRGKSQEDDGLKYKELYEHLYKTTPIMLHSIDSEGKLISVSDCWLETLEYEADEVIGKKSIEFLTEESQKFAQDVVLPDYMQRGYCVEIPYQMVTKSGEIIDVLLSATAEKDEQDNVVRSLAVMQNVTQRNKFERQLRQSEEHYRDLYNRTPVMLHSNDKDGNITHVSDLWLEKMEYSREEVIGKKSFTFLTDECRELVKAKIYPDFLKNSYTKNAPLQFKTKSGKLIDVLLSSYADRDKVGALTRSLAVINDVTAQRVAEANFEASEQKFNLAVEGSSVGFWYWEIATGEIYISPRLKNILRGDEKLEVTFDDFVDRLHHEDVERIQYAINDHLKNGSNYDVEYRIRCEDGEYIWAQARGQAAWDEAGEPTHMAGSLNDITSRKKAELKLEQAVKELTESNDELERFAYICSHDLQEPLRMVTSFTHKLAEHYAEHLEGDEKAQKYMRFVTDGANQSQDLIKDILNYARLKKEAQFNEEVNLEEVITEVKKTLAVAMAEKPFTLSVDCSHKFLGSKSQITQVMLNLVSNAVKFCHKDPVIEVTTTQTSEGIQVSVKDNGIGIKPEYHSKIFTIFERLHNSNYSGTGIGLAICKKVAESHNGTIWVESEFGQGSTFCFTVNTGGADQEVA